MCGAVAPVDVDVGCRMEFVVSLGGDFVGMRGAIDEGVELVVLVVVEELRLFEVVSVAGNLSLDVDSVRSGLTQCDVVFSVK